MIFPNMRTTAFFLFLTLFVAGLGGSTAARERAQQKAGTSAVSAGGVPERRLAHLRHGINLSDWFAQVGDPGGYNKQHFDTAITPHDLDLIQAMGFDHVRLSVDPRPMSMRARRTRSRQTTSVIWMRR
jgi:hypothetical protein